MTTESPEATKNKQLEANSKKSNETSDNSPQKSAKTDILQSPPNTSKHTYIKEKEEGEEMGFRKRGNWI